MIDVTKYITGKLDSFLESINTELNQTVNNRILEYQVEQYKRAANVKTILHRVYPVKLMDIYFNISIESNRNKTKISSAKELFQKYKDVLLLGYAGSGKSTLTKFLILKSIEENFKLPISIELRHLSAYKKGIIDYVYENCFKFKRISDDEKIIERLLDSGNFLIIFDGFDEIPYSFRSKRVNEINSFVEKFNNNSFLLTSRPYTNISLLPIFRNFNVCELNENEVKGFIKKQLSKSEDDISEKIIESVTNEDNSDYKGFLKNPLLLSMYILTFKSYANIPTKRTSFYNQVFEALYSVHDSLSKLAFKRKMQSGLSKDDFEELLMAFSYMTYFEQELLYDKKSLNKRLNFIKEKNKKFEFENEEVIEDLSVSIGLLVIDGLQYSFAHRALQEYFAALFIANFSSKNKKAFYTSLFDKIINKQKSFSEFKHFYSLVEELDFIDLHKSFSIPCLELLIEKSKYIHSVSEFDKYYIDLNYLITSILEDNELKISRIPKYTESGSLFYSPEVRNQEENIHTTLIFSNRIKELKKEIKLRTDTESDMIDFIEFV